MDQKLLFARVCSFFKCLQENWQKWICAVRLIAVQVAKNGESHDSLKCERGSAHLVCRVELRPLTWAGVSKLS